VRPGRVEKVLASTSAFVYFGTAGQTLWSDPAADAPVAGDPAIMSADCETVLILERREDAWTAAAYTFSGKRLGEWDSGQRVEKAALTRNGRYGSVLWGLVDKPLTYTFFDVRSGARTDLPAADAPLGQAQIQEDGSVVAGARTVYRFR